MKNIVVAGIGTGIGKTFISAIIVEVLQADYWKPVQAGNLDFSDTQVVRELISNSKSVFHPEAYRLTEPMSPHAAAEIDGVKINLNKLSIPKTKNTLIIEIAGGLMVPLNDKELNIDLLKKWDAPVILISKNYLGSINHTLLSFEILKNHKIKMLGIIFNGKRNSSSENFILTYTKLNCIARINEEPEVNKDVVMRYADELKDHLKKILKSN